MTVVPVRLVRPKALATAVLVSLTVVALGLVPILR